MAIDIVVCNRNAAIEAGQIPDTGGQQQQQEQPFTYTGQPCMVRSREQELVLHRGRKPQASEDLVFQSCQFGDKIEADGQTNTFWLKMTFQNHDFKAAKWWEVSYSWMFLDVPGRWLFQRRSRRFQWAFEEGKGELVLVRHVLSLGILILTLFSNQASHSPSYQFFFIRAPKVKYSE